LRDLRGKEGLNMAKWRKKDSFAKAVGRSLAHEGRGIAKGVCKELAVNRDTRFVQTAPQLEKEAMKLDKIESVSATEETSRLRALADSIAEVGLLHPVVVTPDGRIDRRSAPTEACRATWMERGDRNYFDLLQAARGKHMKNSCARICCQVNCCLKARNRAG